MTKCQIADKVYLVGSGKGGVGKSTITVNLAIALAAQGLSVGILDADVYGPSIPIMLGLRRLHPRTEKRADGKEWVIPFSKFGVHVLSLGCFIEEAQPVLWRGPMLHGALEKMCKQVSWGRLDFLLVDLPPGTGDVPITLTQITDVSGAFIIITPQEVARLDAVKAANAFHSLQIPLMGIVENMAGFTTPDGQEHALFGHSKGEEFAMRFDVPFLGSLPFLPDLVEGGDEGIPSAWKPQTLSYALFEALARIVRALDEQRACH